MSKKWIYYTSIILIVAFISSGFKTFENQKKSWLLTTKNKKNRYLFPSLQPNDYLNLNAPFTGKTFTGFKENLAFSESQGQFKLINSLGYIGKYQFGGAALRTIGIKDNHHFLNSPNMQESAFIALLSINKSVLKEEIEQFDGTTLNGIEITESGILAAAHLGGAGSVKKFFKSRGKRSIKDDYGTSIQCYLKKFSGYDTSIIIADSGAKI